jgi:SAM-dependent methyltransferase
MDEDKRHVDRESGIQGSRWQDLHQGYFSHSGIADPLVDFASGVIAVDRPDVVVDLGGGTGRLLQLLSEQHPERRVRLVNADLSAKQLAECDRDQIETLEVSALKIRREDIRVGDGRLLFLMRSLLHYFGRDGLAPLLRHLRSQMKSGELFVHQTACFADEQDAQCANRLYELMRTDKWYPTIDELRRSLEGSGLDVMDVRHAPPLALESSELMDRYQLSAADVLAIRDDLTGRAGGNTGVLKTTGDGFIAWLHYSIFVCRAA